MGKKYGQHFLRSGAILDKIAAAAEVRPGEPLLEIGPGEGALTERLLAAGARLTAIEIDPALFGPLRARFGGRGAFRLIEGDVLEVPLEPGALFEGEAPDRFPIVANLPYYLTTPLLFRLVVLRAHLSRLVLMVQREIAERLVAGPADGKAYGSLSIAARHAFEMRRLFNVPPGAFRPPPKVDSAVVYFAPKPPVLPPDQEQAFLDHVKKLFTARRKLMRSTVRRMYPDAEATRVAEAEARVGERRPEALTPEEHLAVFRIVTGGSPPT
jgi:16S rRNA (adenine1518-N6/adenine1519-N6)-dimethyltransferase